MKTVENFILGLDGQQKAIVSFFHQLLTEEYDLQDKIRFKIPFYYRKSWVCYLNPLKSGGVELAFTRANELSNDQGLLDFKDRKQIAGIEIQHISEIPSPQIKEILYESILLDDLVKYSVRKNK